MTNTTFICQGQNLGMLRSPCSIDGGLLRITQENTNTYSSDYEEDISEEFIIIQHLTIFNNYDIN